MASNQQNSMQNSNNNANNTQVDNNLRKEKIIIQNQMIINVQQQQQQQQQQQHQQQHQEINKRSLKRLTQPPAIFATATVTDAAVDATNCNMNNNNNQEIPHFIANSPTAATYVQAQLNGISLAATDNSGNANSIPIVTYNGNQYCVITRADGINSGEKPELLQLRGQLTTDKEGKANFILMSPMDMQTVEENQN